MAQCPIGTFFYTIRPGDTLWLIARRYHTTIYAIAALNPGIDLNNLYVDEIEKQALEMADAMADGIVKQFPDKFKMCS